MTKQVFSVEVSESKFEIEDERRHLKMVSVPRGGAKDLDNQWSEPGIYLLLEEGPNASWRSYVGKATNLSVRILRDRHLEDFEWNRELLVRRSPGFDTTEIGWLEGRIYRLLKEAGVGLANKQTPGDDTLRESRREVLEEYVGVIQSALTLLGYPVGGQPQALEQETQETEAERGERGSATTGDVAKLLDVVSVGQQIESTSPSHPASATIVAEGIRYERQVYKSPTAAAKAVTGSAVNGWYFWGVKRGRHVVRLRDLRDQESSPKPQRRSNTTPAKMSQATVGRFLARHDEGATYVELGKEFGLTRGSVHKLLKDNGRVKGRS